ncbi:hypothetical protein [Kineosporia sp. NBRC 101677]|uniref:hypothetical protein n=1 Tax=Kineosporia sp. NBRC 101677 TaxID=3032197 RepID=UPI0025566687|nr:hypothetical protein [Kineosporia sp. NBRC 101677]
MRFGRRRDGISDAEVVADVARMLNVPRFAASGMVRQLRSEVTDTLCRLLPGADGPGAAGSERWVRQAGLASARMAPELVRVWEPSIPQESLGSAAIHGT